MSQRLQRVASATVSLQLLASIGCQYDPDDFEEDFYETRCATCIEKGWEGPLDECIAEERAVCDVSFGFACGAFDEDAAKKCIEDIEQAPCYDDFWLPDVCAKVCSSGVLIEWGTYKYPNGKSAC